MKDAASMYIEAYSEPDLSRKQEMLEGSFSTDGVFISENQEIGFGAVLEMVSGFHDVASSMEIVGDVAVHHNYGLFRWQFTDVTSAETVTGVDFCEFAPDGLLRKIVVFFD
jgi:hypothetical protein